MVQDEVYLELGIIIGFQIYKSLEQGFQSMKTEDLCSIIKQYMDLLTKKKSFE